MNSYKGGEFTFLDGTKYREIFGINEKEATKISDVLGKIAATIDGNTDISKVVAQLIVEIKSYYDHWFIRNRHNKINYCIMVISLILGAELYKHEMVSMVNLMTLPNTVVH